VLDDADLGKQFGLLLQTGFNFLFVRFFSLFFSFGVPLRLPLQAWCLLHDVWRVNVRTTDESLDRTISDGPL
jgi:hypothetical protein